MKTSHYDLFIDYKKVANALAISLRDKGIDCAEYHKLLSSQDKEDELTSFKKGDITVLVCTDHAAR